MQDQQLKIIMETLAQLGVAGKEGFIWWLVMHHGLNALCILASVVAFVLVVNLIIRAVKSHQSEYRITTEVAMRCDVRPRMYYNRDDLNKMVDWIRSAP